MEQPWKRKGTHPTRVSGIEKKEAVKNILKIMDDEDEHDFVFFDWFNYQNSLLLWSILRRYLNALTISFVLISVEHPWKRKPTHSVRVSGAEKREVVTS